MSKSQNINFQNLSNRNTHFNKIHCIIFIIPAWKLWIFWPVTCKFMKLSPVSNNKFETLIGKSILLVKYVIYNIMENKIKINLLTKIVL